MFVILKNNDYTGTDSPLSDEVNELVAELSHREHWRILWRTQDQLGKKKKKKDFNLFFIWFKFICYSGRYVVHKGHKKKWMDIPDMMPFEPCPVGQRGHANLLLKP